MRRLILFLAAIAATSAYNLVVQEISLTGGLITSDKITCDMIANLHIGSQTYNVECYEVMSPTEPKTLEARNIVYKGTQITTKASKIDCLITLTDGSTIGFTLSPQMKAGVAQISPAQDGKWTSVDVSTTTGAPTTTKQLNCKDDQDDMKKPQCMCQDVNNKGKDPCTTFCTPDTDTKAYPACEGTAKSTQQAKAVKKTVPRPHALLDCAREGAEAHKPECLCQNQNNKGKAPCTTFCTPDTDTKAYPACEIAATVSVEQIPRAIRLRGPGPVLPPIRQSPPEDAVAADEDEERRVKRAAAEGDPPPAIDDTTIKVSVYYYTLDEPGNPAAVWAAVIEGIILLLLVGACLYFFCWAPRSRAAASAAADPYKEEGPNYSVSYANSSFNQRNERIDAFQNPPAPTPAAPPRPANSAYLDDYITDNIGAMSRPGGTAQPPASSAAAPAFEPRHQRFDSSGLVTVNLS